MSIIPTTKEIAGLATILQKACHRHVEYMVEHGNNVSVQDATNVWIFKELAEIKLQIQLLDIKINSK
jgi:hypothetical protein